MKANWPHIDVLAAGIRVPPGVSMRFFDEEELEELPARWQGWYPTVRVGAESVFLDVDWLRANVVTSGCIERDMYLFDIRRDGASVGMMSFLREPTAHTLHARLGLLAPNARSGVLGALGFPLFEALGDLVEAELLLVWVTLASRTQQFMAKRRGFRLCGVVPGFDRDAKGAGSIRVAEALYAKLLTDDFELPADDALLPETRALLELVLRG